MHIPVQRIVKLLASILKKASGGFSPEERREIAAELLELSGDILKDIASDVS